MTRRRDPFRGGASWRNWAGNQRTDPVRAVTTRTTGEVVDVVKAAARDGLRVKALGAGHSFTGDRRARRRGAARLRPIRRC